MQQVISFVKDARGEWSKVVWPTRRETTRLTVAVITISILMGILIGGLDFIFTNVMDKILIGR